MMEKETNGPTLQAILDLHEKIRRSVPEPPRYNVYIHPDNPYLAEIRESRKRAENFEVDFEALESATATARKEEMRGMATAFIRNAARMADICTNNRVDLEGFHFRMHPKTAKRISGNELFGIRTVLGFPVIEDEACPLDRVYFMKDIQIGDEME